MLKFPNRFIPSEARPSLKLLGSAPKLGYRQSIAFHCRLSAGCCKNPSDLLDVNWWQLDEHWNPRRSVCTMIPRTQGSNAFQQTHLYTKCSRYDMHEFFGTSSPLDIKYSFPSSDSSATRYLQEEFFQ